MIVPPRGPIPARIMLVGEAPGADEERLGKPFVGMSGMELDRMLSAAGISPSECFYTNVARERPPSNDISAYFARSKKDRTNAHVQLRDRWVTKHIVDGIAELRREIQSVHPNIVVALGNTALWALTSRTGIVDWRGSMLHALPEFSHSPGSRADGGFTQTQVIPMFHPAAILRQWNWRWIAIQDLKRAALYRDRQFTTPAYNFTIGVDYDKICNILDQLITRAVGGERFKLTFDIETARGYITCAGIAWSRTEAMCIPFADEERPEGYWGTERESEIVYRLCRLLTHSNVDVVGQNIIYDAQYTWKHWGFVPHIVRDTMISWHSIYSDVRKSLDFQASLLCDYYQYWKREGKEYLGRELGPDTDWYYNCLDCTYTYEVDDVEQSLVERMHLRSVADFQNSMFYPVLRAMQLGVRIDTKRRAELVLEVQDAMAKREAFITELLGTPLNTDSPKQMHDIFYNVLKLPVQMKRAKKGVPGRPTLDDDAMNKLASKEPFIRPLVNAILDCRTLGKFLSNFLLRQLSEDGRMRCSYRIGGAENGKTAPKTYRLASAEDAFGTGTNLQNIPSEKSKSLGKAAARGTIALLGDPYQFPNIREIFVPDPGYTWFDMDLERADLFVVCWEADDSDLKAVMRSGADIHLVNSYIMDGREPPPLDELVESHPRYREHRTPMKLKREFAKVFCHGTNYTGSARTMAINCGITVAAAERAQDIWFRAHPGIRRWHQRVADQIHRHGFVENKFGYRWYIFDRLDSALAEAVAWIPQSTVAVVINKIWRAIYTSMPDVQILMQVHDSLCGQFLESKSDDKLSMLRSASRIVIPYDDPLIIPCSIKTSNVSWGDC